MSLQKGDLRFERCREKLQDKFQDIVQVARLDIKPKAERTEKCFSPLSLQKM